MRRSRETGLRRLALPALLALLINPARAEIVAFPAGGGVAASGGNAIRAVVGQPFAGIDQNGGDRIGAGFLLALDGDLTPVLLLDFTAARTADGVSLEWRCADAEPVDFRLEAVLGGSRRVVLWSPWGPGAYCALDDDASLAAGGEIAYRLFSRENETADWQPLGRAALSLPVAAIPTSLGTAHPNPFNPATKIAFSLRDPGRVRLSVHDASGRLVRTLLDADLPAGRREIEWNGADGAGVPQASGVYLLRMETAGFAATRRLVLLK